MNDEPTMPEPPPVLHFAYETGLCWQVTLTGSVLHDEPVDTMDDPFRSPIRVLEDGKPLPWPHAPHSEIRSCGGGRYSHWGSTVRFSTSDNSNPLTNGRRYELVGGKAAVTLVGTLRTGNKPVEEAARLLEEHLARIRQYANDVDTWFTHVRDRCWRIDLARLVGHYGGTPAEVRDISSVTEAGLPLGPGSAPPEAIAKLGGGRWSVDPHEGVLHLSASDGSNPKLNGRSYSVTIGGRPYPVPQSLTARAMASLPDGRPDERLVGLVRSAYQAGVHWQGRHRFDAEYYPFLAGLAQRVRASRILEIGSERGGSAEAMVMGMGDAAQLLVTVDVVDQARRLDGRAGILKIIDDAAADRAVQKVLAAFDHRPIDILFVDSAHEYTYTLQHIAIYAALLRPRLVVIDDIVLNESMALLWADLCRLFGERAVNACDIEPRIRNCDCGFGLVLWYDWSELTAGRPAVFEQEA